MVLLWLWCKPVATALIRPLAWNSPYAVGAALKKTKNKKRKKMHHMLADAEENIPDLQRVGAAS